MSNLKDIVENMYDFLANNSGEICGGFYKLDIFFCVITINLRVLAPEHIEVSL